jgi:outer membrane cobalamin receptor
MKARFICAASMASSACVSVAYAADVVEEVTVVTPRAELKHEAAFGGRSNALIAGVDVSRTDFSSPRNYSAPFGLQQRVDPWAPPAVDFFTFGRARVRARETDIEAWRPLSVLLIEANVAVLDAQYDEFHSIERATDRRTCQKKSRTLTSTTKFATRWSDRASLRYVGDFAANTSNSMLFPSYTLADLRMRYAFGAATEAAVFIFNVLDEDYAAWATAAGGQSVMANIGAPRTVSAQLRMKF